MAIVDEKGRLFGKVNLLDLVVVLLVLAVAGRFGYSRLKANVATGQDKVIEMAILVPNVSKATVDALKVGDVLKDSKSGTVIGKLVKVEPAQAVVAFEDPAGMVHQRQASPDRFDVRVTVSGTARVTDNGVMMGAAGGIEMKVGRSNQYTTPMWAGNGTTVGFTLNPEAAK